MLITSRLCLAAMLLAVAANLPARDLPLSDDAIVNTGNTLYQVYCAECHGADARGGTVDTPTSTQVVPDLTLIAERNDGAFPFWELYEIISGAELLPAHGGRTMPIWSRALRESSGAEGEEGATLARGRIMAIMAWLATVQR